MTWVSTGIRDRLQRKQRRVDGRKVNYWVDTVTWAEYRTKADAGLRRSDTKPVSQNNVIVVTMKLLAEYELPLVTMLEAVYRDTEDAEVLNMLRLVGATKDAVSDIVFLAAYCQPSADFYAEKSTLALQLAYKFILKFFPEELENPENINMGTFRPRRAYTECTSMDDGTETATFRFADAATVDAVQFRL